MKALTLHRPWAWAIVAAGKDIENRTWKPPRSIIGQRIAIHAGQALDVDALQFLGWALDVPPADLPAGWGDLGIVGTAVVTGFVTASNSRWFDGPIGWCLDEVERLAEPIPCRGAQGLWTVPDAVAQEVR